MKLVDPYHVRDYGWRSAELTRSQRMMLPFVTQQLKHLGARKILDIGCGNGALSHILMKHGFEVVGMDADEKAVFFARQGGTGEFLRLSVYDDPTVIPHSFDAAVCLEVIEHLFFPAAVPKFAHQVLVSGGHLLVSTPYHGWLKNLVISLLNRWDQHWDPIREGGHIKFFSKRTLTSLLSRNGFSVVAFFGIGRVPFLWKSMLVIGKKQ